MFEAGQSTCTPLTNENNMERLNMHRRPNTLEQRMFDILVEGAELLTAYDVFAEAGDALAAATATLTTTVSDGVLEITIQHNVGGSILNGVEVSAGTGTPPPSEPLGTPGQPYIDD